MNEPILPAQTRPVSGLGLQPRCMIYMVAENRRMSMTFHTPFHEMVREDIGIIYVLLLEESIIPPLVSEAQCKPCTLPSSIIVGERHHFYHFC